MTFADFFKHGAGGYDPYPYQSRLAANPWPETLIIPTGLGKTAAVISAWIWKRINNDPDTPRRLVMCLPMRTLVEQTYSVAEKWAEFANQEHSAGIRLGYLMGGHGSRQVPDWMMHPERPTILVGTQDLLMSAALMRGYGMPPARWPMAFALLNNDAFWVFDEVQLAGAALKTSAQLAAFRQQFSTAKPCRTMWMSATLNTDWLNTVDHTPASPGRRHDLSAADMEIAGRKWNAAKQPHRMEIPMRGLKNSKQVQEYAGLIAKKAAEVAEPAANAIVFVNTVKRARLVYAALRKLRPEQEVILVHSRFRKADRDRIVQEITAEPPAAGRIIVSTQALEAGIDISSSRMITELAPWPSMIQRGGRLNRYGEYAETQMWWTDLADDAAMPYDEADFAESRAKMADLCSFSPAAVAEVPLVPDYPGRVLRKADLLGFFDTDLDLTGTVVNDVSPYVRDADDTDVRFFWRELPHGLKYPDNCFPAPDAVELCPVSISDARAFLKKDKVNAWIHSPVGKRWDAAKHDGLVPGMVVCIEAKSGGYTEEAGFDPNAKGKVPPILMDDDNMPENFDSELNAGYRVSLVKHTEHGRDEVKRLARALGMEQWEIGMLERAMHWHDAGKAHPVFIKKYSLTETPDILLAKWNDMAIGGSPKPDPERRYFRHELASALLYLAYRDWTEDDMTNLTAYVIMAHHGKVRLRITPLLPEQPPVVRGVQAGDIVPGFDLGGGIAVDETELSLDLMQLGGSGRCGASWTSRVSRLLDEYGPFRLAWYETILRIADWRASHNEGKEGRDDL